MGVRTAWCDYAPRLAAWAFSRLVVRRDVWGGYWTTPQGNIRPTTKPWPKGLRGRALLTLQVLRQHFAAENVQQLIGTHTTGPNNRCSWGGYDIDNHGEADPAQNWRWARALYEALAICGFRPLLTESNGKGGYHCRILIRGTVPAEDLFHLLARVAKSVDFPGEQFPKQRIISANGYGNWLRLPGRHKSGDGYPRAWDGCRWVDEDAVPRWLLAFGGDEPALIPAAPPMPRITPHRRSPLVQRAGRGGGLSRRITAYLAKLPALGEGQGRDDVAYQAGAWLVHDLGLTEAQALEWLRRWDSRNCPPKGDERLSIILQNVSKYGGRGGHHGV